MDNVAFWTAIVGCVTNLILLITQLVQVVKLKKEMKDVKVIVNSTAELKQSLCKPFEGTWEVRGEYIKYHGVEAPHYCNGFVNFTWNEVQKRYDIYYVYSVRKEGDNSDLVTAVCKGISVCNEEGNLIRNDKLTLELTICNRSSADGVTNQSPTFEFCSDKVEKIGKKYSKIKFVFKNKNSNGNLYFVR